MKRKRYGHLGWLLWCRSLIEPLMRKAKAFGEASSSVGGVACFDDASSVVSCIYRGPTLPAPSAPIF